MAKGESAPIEPQSAVDRFFGLTALGTSVGTELRAGLATFLTMAYIMFVNPAILQQAGMDHGAVFVATCLAAAAGSVIMGLYANYPIALAPGMGLNAYFAFTMVPELGGNWQLALGVVFVSGLLFFAMSLTPIRARHRRRHRPVPGVGGVAECRRGDRRSHHHRHAWRSVEAARAPCGGWLSAHRRARGA
jgi:hypothetical protein